MLLAVDVGNTETVLGVFRETKLFKHWRLSTQPERTADELALLFGGCLEREDLSFSKQITGLALSSVVPSATHALREMTRRYFHFDAVVVGPGTKTGIPVLTDNPHEVGADRIVNSLAAFSRYGGPCVVVDFGTATTYDAVSARGEYLGGAIAPGIQASLSGLFSAAARLPQVDLQEPRSVIGKTTAEAIQSGLLFGTAAEVDGMVEMLEKELGEATVVATGGLAEAIVPHCSQIDHHDPWLTLEGLRLVFEKNAGLKDE